MFYSLAFLILKRFPINIFFSFSTKNEDYFRHWSWLFLPLPFPPVFLLFHFSGFGFVLATFSLLLSLTIGKLTRKIVSVAATMMACGCHQDREMIALEFCSIFPISIAIRTTNWSNFLHNEWINNWTNQWRNEWLNG